MVAIPDQLTSNIGVMATALIAPRLSSKKLLCKVECNSNSEHNTMETVCDSILMKITIIAIIILQHSCQMVRIIADGLIHQICASYDLILIVIFSPCIVLIDCELTMARLRIIIRFIIECVMIYKLTLAAYHSCYIMTTKTSGIIFPRKTTFGHRLSMYRM